MPDSADLRYAGIFMAAIGACRRYKPKFGGGSKGGLAFSEFRDLYGNDPFYGWLGLDSPLVYGAHKAAGGMTSLYRQIGQGCQLIYSQILKDRLGLDETEASWSYQVSKPSRKLATLSLDARIPIDAVRDVPRRNVIREWLNECTTRLELDPDVAGVLKGAVFEVRQGYKSKDAKRQNADLANASMAYTKGYLPVMLVLSKQIDVDLLARYTQAKWLILTGELEGNPTESTYPFVRDVVGYDLAKFFSDHSAQFRTEIEVIVGSLLTP